MTPLQLLQKQHKVCMKASLFYYYAVHLPVTATISSGAGSTTMNCATCTSKYVHISFSNLFLVITKILASIRSFQKWSCFCNFQSCHHHVLIHNHNRCKISFKLYFFFCSMVDLVMCSCTNIHVYTSTRFC